MEEWRSVRGFHGYEVSSEGRIRSHLHKGKKGWIKIPYPPRLLSTKPAPDGYVVMGLTVAKNTKRFIRLHTLVAEAFLGPRPQARSKRGRWTYDIDHINGDKADNRACNLRYITHGENVRRSPNHPSKNPRRGEECRGSKLTENDIINIRRLAGQGYSRRRLGEMFGVSGVCITHVVNRKTWKHVP